MTNREYQIKQHRGSSPSSNTAMQIPFTAAARHTEEWKDRTWYPRIPQLPNITNGPDAALLRSGPSVI